MYTRRGFTVVELVVVMVIMAILLAIGGLSIRSSQANARDAERTSDIEILARGLETRYTRGKINPDVTAAPAYVKPGTYPSINEMRHIIGQSVAGFTPAQITTGYGSIALPGTSTEAFSPPGLSNYSGFTVSTCNDTADIDKMTPTPSICLNTLTTKDTYVYEPIDADGALCVNSSDGCVRFNLYYKKETGDTALQQLRSKHQ